VGATATLVVATLAPAAPAGTHSAPPGTPSHRHCVVAAYPAGVGPQAQVAEPACFDTFAAAISHATDGTVRLPHDATEVTQAQLDAGRDEPGPASTVIGIEYEDSGYGGQDWVIAQANGCDDGGAEVWLRADLTGHEMNNEISSARAYNGCKSRHFEHANFSGDHHLCGCAQMGAMSDRTTSIRWSASGF
jgi:hypothetical protein